MAETSEEVISQNTIVSELGMEMEKMGETIKELLELIDMKEMTEKLEKLDESRANAEEILRQLGESFAGTI